MFNLMSNFLGSHQVAGQGFYVLIMVEAKSAQNYVSKRIF